MIRRTLLLLLVPIWLALPSTASAQKDFVHFRDTIVPPPHVLLLNLGGLALDYLNVSYYRRLNDFSTVGGYLGYLYHVVGPEKVTGYGLGFSYRYHPGGRAPARFYYMGTLGAQRGELVGSEEKATGFMAAAMIGWQWFAEEHFAVGLGGGGRIIFGTRPDNVALADAFGASPVITLDLGYGW